MIEFIILITWIVLMIYFMRWLVWAIKEKSKYEASMCLAMTLYFTSIMLSIYFKQVYDNILLFVFGMTICGFGIFIFISQLIIMKKLGQGENWEDTKILIIKGWFKYMRHPMYFGLAIANIGIILGISTLLTLILAPTSILFCLLSSIWEDQENLEKFGNSYEEYKKKVKLWGII